LHYGWNPPYWFTRDGTPTRGLSHRDLVIATMTREFESLTKRFDEGHLKSKETAAECRMAYVLVEDVL
jgi:hypothetical protein